TVPCARRSRPGARRHWQRLNRLKTKPGREAQPSLDARRCSQHAAQFQLEVVFELQNGLFDFNIPNQASNNIHTCPQYIGDKS
ncbi:hypothetical protein A2U01_0087625, partial [Trifolium medium]|nr:hypothetical protein [Trifolium medium]